MDEIKPTRIDEASLDRLLGIESSKIGYYAEVKQKIRELEIANANLRAKKSELQAVFDSISDGVVIYNSLGRIQHRNHICPRLFPEQTMPGRSCRELFHPEQDLAAEQCPVEKALRGESTQISFTNSSSGGENRYFDVTASPIVDAQGQTRALVFLRDVTERRVQELHLVQAEKMSSIGMLAAGVAHEINNPLTSVAGYAEALLRRFRDEPRLAENPSLEVFPDYLQVIMREAYRCKSIIDSLLTFSRRSDGSVGLVSINDILNEVLDLVRNKALQEQVLIEEERWPSLPPINADAAALRQVFMNLTMNAIQAIKGPGQIRIRTFAVDDEVVVEVSDSGCGIAPEHLDQIWDPFFTTKTVGNGLGLGLAITYSIIERHQGHIEVVSQVNKGCTFKVRLPVCPM
ncbi:two-component system sensor histidine kinase NtrB [Geoalkalibacter sp.]|uniref:two-component system sensor histidine kinase NtrB n=1 Tax=Geoalkalibacter sp. TaxID=3041440 RepID=UPI00272E28DE|nr:ATP-binding protein [Geoalkalibacter sp.]